MKHAIIVLLLVLSTAACSKTATPAPDAGSQVAGTYAINYVESDSAGVVLFGQKLPIANATGTQTVSGSLTARRDSANAVFLTQTFRATGQSDQTGVIGEVNLRTSGTGYDMYMNNQKIGTADDIMINIDDQYTDTQTGTKYRYVIMAVK